MLIFYGEQELELHINNFPYVDMEDKVNSEPYNS